MRTDKLVLRIILSYCLLRWCGTPESLHEVGIVKNINEGRPKGGVGGGDSSIDIL